MSVGQAVTEKVQVWIHGVDSKARRKVLLLQTNIRRGRFWQPVTGRVEPGEKIELAAHREPSEETGFDLPKPEALDLDLRFGSFHETCFEIELPVHQVGQPAKIDPKEHDQFEWTTPEDAMTRLKHDSNRQALRRLLEKIDGRAPEFELADQDGSPFRMSRAAKESPLLLVFYPGDFTPVCTRQLCEYRDDWNELGAGKAKIIGISPDAPQKHQEFIRKYGFQFPLLSDPNREVFGQYGVRSKWMLGGWSRGVFLMDRNRRIVFRHVEATPLTFRRAQSLREVLNKI